MQDYQKEIGNAWIQTWSGLAFNPLAPHLTPDGLSIIDIAHALANINRFTGHTIRPYSVGEHSVRCSWVTESIDPTCRPFSLLHDATEAYIHDIASPVKRMFPEYIATEDRLMNFIAKQFGLPVIMPNSVKKADRFMLAVESRDLLNGPLLPGWGQWDGYETGEDWVMSDPQLAPLWEASRRWNLLEEGWSQVYAKRMFLHEFRALFPGFETPGFPEIQDFACYSDKSAQESVKAGNV